MAKKNVVIKRKKKKLILIRLSIISLILLTSIIYVATILNKPHFTTQAQTIEYLNDSLIVSNLETRSIPNRFSTEPLLIYLMKRWNSLHLLQNLISILCKLMQIF